MYKVASTAFELGMAAILFGVGSVTVPSARIIYIVVAGVKNAFALIAFMSSSSSSSVSFVSDTSPFVPAFNNLYEPPMDGDVLWSWKVMPVAASEASSTVSEKVRYSMPKRMFKSNSVTVGRVVSKVNPSDLTFNPILAVMALGVMSAINELSMLIYVVLMLSASPSTCLIAFKSISVSSIVMIVSVSLSVIVPPVSRTDSTVGDAAS